MVRDRDNKRQLPRWRYWRGHGIHSPFMYGIIRNVFMKRRLIGNNRELYDTLKTKGGFNKTAMIVQNLQNYLGRNCCIILSEADTSYIEKAIIDTAEHKEILVILANKRATEHRTFIMDTIQKYPCVSIDRKDMILCFYEEGLKPQHYRL